MFGKRPCGPSLLGRYDASQLAAGEVECSLRSGPDRVRADEAVLGELAQIWRAQKQLIDAGRERCGGSMLRIRRNRPLAIHV